MKMICPQCTAQFEARTGHANRAAKTGAPLYCGRTCAGLARRLPAPKSVEQKKAEKAAYDRKYRQRDPEARKAERAAYYQRTRDPEKERELRKAKMPQHVEYCRRPEYRAYKREYECDFDASIEGAYYARLLTEAETDKRIARVPYDPGLEVHAARALLLKRGSGSGVQERGGPVMDYAALAAKYGGKSAEPDYAALAAKFGGKAEDAGKMQESASVDDRPPLMRTMQNLVGGAVRGAGSIGATILAPYDMARDALDGKGLSLESNRQRRADMTAGLDRKSVV